MFKLFDVVPFQFFQILASPNREMYANILFSIYLECENGNSYTFSKEDFISLIKDYFDSHENEKIADTEAVDLKDSRDKANWLFRKLKSSGWIDTEFIANGEQLVNLEDHAIIFLNAYINYEAESDLELSSYVYHIYNNINDIEGEKGYFLLRDTITKVNDLIQKLRTLNSNIKKYTKKIIKLNNKSDKEQLEAILDQLLNDYKIKVVDKAYFYMKTNDNPIKYKSDFINKCQKIHYDEAKSYNIIEQIIKEDQIAKEDAIIRFDNIMNELEGAFDRIIDIINEIDKKNNKYINVAIERIRILLNHDRNIEGLLLNILKNINIANEEDLTFSFFDNRNILSTSLYTPRSIIKINAKPVVLKPHDEDNENSIKFMQKLKRSSQFSQKAIREYVDTLLNSKEKVDISDFNIKDNDEFIKLILIFVYSESKKNNYKIIWGNKENKVGNIYLPNFRIERKEE